MGWRGERFLCFTLCQASGFTKEEKRQQEEQQEEEEAAGNWRLESPGSVTAASAAGAPLNGVRCRGDGVPRSTPSSERWRHPRPVSQSNRH